MVGSFVDVLTGIERLKRAVVAPRLVGVLFVFGEAREALSFVREQSRELCSSPTTKYNVVCVVSGDNCERIGRRGPVLL